MTSAIDPHEAFVRLEREIGLLLRRARAISSRLAAELHPDLDGAAYGLLALLEDALDAGERDPLLGESLDLSEQRDVARAVAPAPSASA